MRLGAAANQRKNYTIRGRILKVSDSTNIAMPMRNLISILGAVAIAAWAYFGIQERLNIIETNYQLIQQPIERNSEFRIKWPRGLLGSLPADARQFDLITHHADQLLKIQERLDEGAHNAVNIQRLRDDMIEARENIEKLKDAIRNVTQ